MLSQRKATVLDVVKVILIFVSNHCAWPIPICFAIVLISSNLNCLWHRLFSHVIDETHANLALLDKQCGWSIQSQFCKNECLSSLFWCSHGFLIINLNIVRWISPVLAKQQTHHFFKFSAVCEIVRCKSLVWWLEIQQNHKLCSTHDNIRMSCWLACVAQKRFGAIPSIWLLTELLNKLVHNLQILLDDFADTHWVAILSWNSHRCLVALVRHFARGHVDISYPQRGDISPYKELATSLNTNPRSTS